jgi:thiol-disulfide isomerase/thioredoxin/outer membrane lipoprotein-sorting protein
MASLAVRSGATFAYLLFVASLAMLVANAGCGKGSSPTASVPSGEEATASNGDATADTSEKTAARPDAARLLEELAAKYKDAKTYQDAGELQISVETQDGQKDSAPVMPFSVALERPDKLRVHSLEASIVADGKKLWASATSLEGQVLLTANPQPISIESLGSDELLVRAMRGQLELRLPQLLLLLDKDPIQTIAGGGTPELLDDESHEGQPCHRVAIKGEGGSSIFWISQASGLLVKFEFPSDSFRDQYSFAKASIAAELKGAKVDAPIDADAFKFDLPEGAKLLTRFLPPPPSPPISLLGQTPGDFKFVNFADGSAIDRESLKGKVVVLDVWATWCHWCFEGFPNLQKVYDEFKDNDKVVILAVNTDELAVSDEKVRKSFEDKKLTIPIARDQEQAAAKAFQVEGLPTMLVLGPDGTVEDYHVGYDAQLAKTLPPKLKKLLEGESLAKEELETYQKKLAEYKAEEEAALVKDDAPKAE